MKKINQLKLLLLLNLMLLLVGGMEPVYSNNSYKINGTVVGIKQGEIYLVSGDKIDTVRIVNGRFTLENSINDPVMAVTFVKDLKNFRTYDKKNILTLYLEAVQMTLDLDYNEFSNSKLIGSKTQDDYYKLLKLYDKIANKFSKENKVYDELTKKHIKAIEDRAGQEVISKLKMEANEYKEKLEPMHTEQREVTFQFIKDNPKSFISLSQLVFFLTELKYEEAKSMYDNFDVSYKDTSSGQLLFKKIELMKKAVPGLAASDFTATDSAGNLLKLQDYRGKYVLIDFWASWCLPCRKSNPELIKLYNKYNTKGFEILGVSDDDGNPEAWRKAILKDNIGIWKHVLRGYGKRPNEKKSDINELFNVTYLPTKVLIGPDGIIISRYERGTADDEVLEKKLQEIFKI